MTVGPAAPPTGRTAPAVLGAVAVLRLLLAVGAVVVVTSMIATGLQVPVTLFFFYTKTFIQHTTAGLLVNFNVNLGSGEPVVEQDIVFV